MIKEFTFILFLSNLFFFSSALADSETFTPNVAYDIYLNGQVYGVGGNALATHFLLPPDAGGGCGVPLDAMPDKNNYVALNVYSANVPFDQTPERPVSSEYGDFDNGKNCGRWMEVTIGDLCPEGSGSSNIGGADPSPDPCLAYSADPDYTGVTINMVVADSCGDGNYWCRESINHLDISEAADNFYFPNGEKLSQEQIKDLQTKLTAAQLTWKFIDNPTTDAQIIYGTTTQAKGGTGYAYVPLIVTNLPSGILGGEYTTSTSNPSWQNISMNGDEGQQFSLQSPLTSSMSQFVTRLYDYQGNLYGEESGLCIDLSKIDGSYMKIDDNSYNLCKEYWDEATGSCPTNEYIEIPKEAILSAASCES